jgi:hypothetical protein
MTLEKKIKSKQNKIVIIIIIILFCLLIFNINNNITNEQENLELIKSLVEKFLDPKNVPILTEKEKFIAQYWNEQPLCPFSKLVSHGLTREEALKIISFFKIEGIEDLEKLKIFMENQIKK